MTRLRLVYGFTYSEQVEPIQRMFWLFLFVSIKILEGVWIEKRKKSIDTAINHLKVSEECKNKYVDAYGPQYKCILQKVTNKGKRVQKRVAQNTGPSVCKFCPAAADKLLLVHLRSNPHCKKQYMDHYMCKSEKGMRAEIIKEKAKMRKRKQRGTNL